MTYTYQPLKFFDGEGATTTRAVSGRGGAGPSSPSAPLLEFDRIFRARAFFDMGARTLPSPWHFGQDDIILPILFSYGDIMLCCSVIPPPQSASRSGPLSPSSSSSSSSLRGRFDRSGSSIARGTAAARDDDDPDDVHRE